MADPATALEQVFAPVAPPIAGALAAGPYNFQFTGEDNLRLTVTNSLAGVAVGVHYRTAPTPTTIQTNKQVIVPTSNRLPSTTEFSVGPGYLLNVTVFATAGAPKIGQTFVKLQVIRGMGASAIVLGTVVQGYVTANQDRAWPGSPIETSLESEGVYRTIIGTDPAVGAECSEVVPTGARWEVVTFRAVLSTAAPAGARRPMLSIESPTNGLWLSAQPATVDGGSTMTAHWSQGGALTPAPSASFPLAVLPTRLVLTAGSKLTTATLGLNAGDDYDAPRYIVREWLEVD